MSTLTQFEKHLNGLITAMETLSREAGVSDMTISYEAPKTSSPESSGIALTYRTSEESGKVILNPSDTYLPESLRKMLTKAIDAYHERQNKIIFRKFI